MKTPRLLLSALSLVILAACGGGGGGGGGVPIFPLAPPAANLPSDPPGNPPGNQPGTQNPPTSNPSPIDAHYKYLTFEQDRDPDTETETKRFDDYMALLNREGAAGYRYIEGATGGNIVHLQDNFMMVKDSTGTYTYEYKRLSFDILQSTALEALLQQMKEQGAQGKVFVKLLPMIGLNSKLDPEFGVLYRKENGSSATYDYTALPYPQTSTEYMNVVNAQGANGFRPYVVPELYNHATLQFFIKESDSQARYEARLLVSPLSEVGGEDKDVKAQIRAQGAQGFRLYKSRFMEDSKQFIFYLKDTTQSASFEYEFLENPDTLFGLQEANAVQANEQTKQGLRYFGAPDAPIFFRSLNCSGALCVSPVEGEHEDGN